MKKHLSIITLIVLLLSSSATWADVLPEGQVSLPVCSTVTNLNDFSDYYLIGVSAIGIAAPPVGDVTVDQIRENECVPGYYHLADYENFAVLKTDFPDADFSSIEGFDDERLIATNLTLPSDRMLVNEPTDIKKFENRYKLLSITPEEAVMYRLEEKTVYNDGNYYSRLYDENGVMTDETVAHPIFSDVPADNRYFQSVLYLKNKGYVKGYDDGTYRPNQRINRAEFTKILINATRSSEVIEGCLDQQMRPEWTYVFFPDVPRGAWFDKYICVAKIDAILKGYPDGTFRPDQFVNMAEAYKIALTATLGTELFSEADPRWYDTYFSYALENDLAIYPTLDPERQITRGDMADLIYKIDHQGQE